MKLNQIDLNLFVVFDTVYREGNLTRAADVLNITQPAVSNALGRLRENFQDQLFIRSGRSMNPTPFARDIAPSIQQALSQLQIVCNEDDTFDPLSSEKTFRFAMNEITASHLLPTIMKLMSEEAPLIKLESFQLSRSEVRSELSVGKVDFALDIALPPSLAIKRASVLDQDYVCVMRRDHPLARKKLSLEQFLDADHIVVSHRRTGLSYIEGEVSKLGVNIKPHLRTQNYAAAFNTVSHTDLLLSVPRQMAEHQDVLIKELPFDTTPLQSFLYWHVTSEQDQAHNWFRERVLKLIRSQEPE